MLGTNYPFEYELTQGTVSEPGKLQWCELRLKNISSDALMDLEVHVRLGDAQGIADSETRSFGTLMPNDSKTMSFQVPAWTTNQAHVSVHGRHQNSEFSWDSAAKEDRDEFRLKEKNEAQRKREERILEIKEEIDKTDEAIDKKAKENEGDVEKWMTGEANP